MADSGHGLSVETLWLFWGARDRNETTNGWRFEPALVIKMKEYLKSKNPTEFLKFSIDHNMRGENLASIHKEVLDIFESPSAYRKLIEDNQLISERIRNEYMQLFDKLAEKNFNEYVEFELVTELRKPEENN